MPADYNIPMTDAQITEALQLMVERVSEGWAQETYDGSPVGSGSPYYHKSSKWWATQAADAAARAEAAVPAGTAGAVFFDMDQSTILTAAQKEQVRKNIMAGGSNENLLDNPFFSVNQRGQSSYSGIVYGFDRWKTYTNNTISKSNDIINITSTGNFNLFQPLREGLVDFLYGKTVTFSMMLSDGSILKVSGTFPASLTTTPTQLGRLDPAGQNIYVYFASAVSAAGIQNPTLQLYGGGARNIDFKAMKLELGSASTLANDAPPDLAEELAKCQRYDRKYESWTGYVYLTTAIATAANTARAVLAGNLRDASRTVTFSNVTLTDGSTSYPVTAISSVSYGGGYTNINITSSGLTVGKVYYLQLAPAGYINLSADL